MTRPTTTDGLTISALVHLIHAIRPDWQTPGIRVALDASAHRDLGALAAVAILTARDPSARTPGAINARLRDEWMIHIATKTAGPRTWPRCHRCEYEITEPPDQHQQHCGQHTPRPVHVTVTPC